MEEKNTTTMTANKIEKPSIQPHFKPYVSTPKTKEIIPAAIIILISSSSKFLYTYI